MGLSVRPGSRCKMWWDWLMEEWEAGSSLLALPARLYNAMTGKKGKASQVIGYGVFIVLLVGFVLVIRAFLPRK